MRSDRTVSGRVLATLLLGGALAIAAASCFPSRIDLDELQFACAASDECLPGYECDGGLCAQVEAPDAGDPDSGDPDAGPDGGPCSVGGVETCSDGVDNNCDLLIDCEEPACSAQPCAANGYACSGSICACGGNGGTVEVSEQTCDDNHDNNCDGLTDCADGQCNGLACGPNGLQCSGTTCSCSGNGGTPQASEQICDDGHDNDCDSLVDCNDTQCNGLACGANGLQCSGTTCSCSGNGGTPQASEQICNDGHDNDCDGQVDCNDAQCNGLACGANGLQCSGTACSCSGNGGTSQASEQICNDGHDNDCDSLVDCNDTQCNGLACGANGRQCSGTTCSCSGNGGPAEAAEQTCNDGHDNDCDGQSDCADVQCDGRVCAGSRTCTLGACPPGYTISASPQAFVDACALPGFTRALQNVDDNSTGILALPFPFSFFGASVSNFRISSNGTISFRPPATSGDPGVSPNCLTAATNPGTDLRPAIYAFRDDLEMGPNGLCWATTGSAPNRTLVVTYSNAHFCCGTPPAGLELTFSVFVRETTNVIDIVYETLTGGGTNGSSALIGLQGQDAGSNPPPYAQHSCMTASVASGTALRFTP